MKIVIKAVFTILLVAYSTILFLNPKQNWDMLAYMAIALEYDGLEPVEVHRETYQMAEQEIDSGQYKLLVSKDVSEYRQECFLDYTAFNHELDFYRVKPLYAGLVFVAYKLGMPLSMATFLPSVIAFFALGLLFFYSFRKELDQAWLHVLAAVFVLLFFPLADLARYSTPDALSNLLLFLMFLVYFYRKGWFIILAIGALAVLARIDNLIPVLLLLLFYFYFLKNDDFKLPHRKKIGLIVLWMLGGVAVAVALFGAISFVSGNSLEWVKLFNHTKSLSNYVEHIKAIPSDMKISGFLIILFISLFLFYFLDNRAKQIALVIYLSIFLRLILFPSFQERFFVAFELVLVLFSIAGVYQVHSSRKGLRI